MVDDGSATPAPEVRREYVYGPDYVDEFIFQAPGANGQGDSARVPFFILQDANYNVMAVTDPLGNVLEQYTYAPYGEILAVDHPQGSPSDLPLVNRLGHQGLFNDRLGSSLESSTGPITLATHVLTPDAVGLYYNRNRYYDPRLGRFTQRDPNETALPILIALASNGEAMDSLLSGISPHDLYGDEIANWPMNSARQCRVPMGQPLPNLRSDPPLPSNQPASWHFFCAQG